MSSQGPWLRISSALYKELERLGQSIVIGMECMVFLGQGEFFFP